MKLRHLIARVMAATMLFGSISDLSMITLHADKTDQISSVDQETGAQKASVLDEMEDGLVLYTSFDEGTVEGNIVKDGSGRGNNGTITGNVTFPEGIVGNAALVENTANLGSDSLAGNAYINFGQPEDLKFGTGDFSIALWMKSINNGQNNSAIISNKNYSSGSNVGFALGNFNNGSDIDNRMNFSGRQGSRAEISKIPANDNEWHHFAVTVKRDSVMTVYLDGKKFGETNLSAHTGTVDTGLDLVLGAGGNKRNALKNVLVDELYIYKKAITPEHISMLYQVVSGKDELKKLLENISRILPGSAYSENGLNQMRAKIEHAVETIDQYSAEERLVLYHNTMAEYEDFITNIEAVPELKFFTVSDMHLKAEGDSRTSDYIAGLKDMKQIDPDANAFITTGDNTGSGTAAQVNLFYQTMAQHKPVSNEGMIINLGNHEVRDGSDIWTNDPAKPTPYYETAKGMYLDKNRDYMPDNGGKVYYDKWINGYHFISLNTEKGLKDSTWLSPAQLIWLEEKLAENASPDKPIFLINHQSLNDTHWRSNILNGFGTEDAQVKEILTRYPQVVMLTGHIHNGFGVAEAVDREFGTLVEIPSYSESENGVKDNGTGYYVMVFSDEIIFRARNFKTSTWLPEYNIQIKLNTLPSAYKAAKNINWEQSSDKEAVKALMAEAETYLNTKYDQSVITGWNDLRPPANALFGKEVRHKINTISLSLQKYLVDTAPVESEFSGLRKKWRNFLLGGDFNPDNEAVSNYLQALNEKVDEYWSKMHKSSESSRTLLWDDLKMDFVSGTGDLAKERSGNISISYYRLRDMAIAYSTKGTNLYQKEEVKAEIIQALDYMYTKYYNESDQNTPFFGNWWNWEIGSPIALLNTAIILYDDLTPQQISNYTKAVNRFSPVADRPSGYPGSPAMTGANLIDKGTAVALSALLSENEGKMDHIKSAFKTVFAYVDTGDGFYRDGSFIQHQALAYIGGYGSDLYEKLSIFFVVLKDSRWELTYSDGAEQLAFDMIVKGIEPFFYKGLFMDMVSGRGITRKESSDKTRGVKFLSSILPLSDAMPDAEMKSHFDSFAKTMISANPEYFYSNCSTILSVVKAYEIMNDDRIPLLADSYKNIVFPKMDKAVYQAPNYTLGLSMHSNRTYGHELINSEGKRTWNISDGMTYLYTADTEQYQDGYWAVVDPTRLSGTTVEHKVFSNGAGDRQKNVYSWVGGSGIGTYGAAGMQYKAHGTGAAPRNGADVKKSWFLFGDEIVALGSGISSDTGNTVETIIDNRKLKADLSNKFVVDGREENIVTADGTAKIFENPAWIHLEGNVEGSDIGYYFPAGGNVSALYEARTGNWSSQGTSIGEVQVGFGTFWFDHGQRPQNEGYAYVILPNKSSIETGEYAVENDITIIKNTSEVHAASKESSGLTAVNFWMKDGGTAAGISVNQPASITMQKKDGILKIAVSDPTQKNLKSTEVIVALPCKEVVSKDSNISLINMENFVKISVNTSNTNGKSSMIELLLDEEADLTVIEVPGFDDIKVPMRTYFNELPLPKTAVITANDLRDYTVDLAWNIGGYDRNTYGRYQLKADLVLPEGIKNHMDLKPNITVQVGEVENGVFQNTYVRGGIYGDVNHSKESGLIIKNDKANISYYRKALLEFDIQDIPKNAEHIYFEFELIDSPAADFTYMNLYQVESGWQENTVTYNDFPGRLSETPVAKLTKEDINAKGLRHKLDITEVVRNAWNQGLTKVALELSNPVPATNDYIALHSSYTKTVNAKKPSLSWGKTPSIWPESESSLESLMGLAESVDPAEFLDFDASGLEDLINQAKQALSNPGTTEEELFGYELQITRILMKLRKKPVPKNL